MYCKGRNEEIKEREDEQEQFKRYLQQVHDTVSVVTSTDESGFVTEGKACEAEHLEDRAGKY